MIHPRSAMCCCYTTTRNLVSVVVVVSVACSLLLLSTSTSAAAAAIDPEDHFVVPEQYKKHQQHQIFEKVGSSATTVTTTNTDDDVSAVLETDENNNNDNNHKNIPIQSFFTASIGNPNNGPLEKDDVVQPMTTSDATGLYDTETTNTINNNKNLLAINDKVQVLDNHLHQQQNNNMHWIRPRIHWKHVLDSFFLRFLPKQQLQQTQTQIDTKRQQSQDDKYKYNKKKYNDNKNKVPVFSKDIFADFWLNSMLAIETKSKECFTRIRDHPRLSVKTNKPLLFHPTNNDDTNKNPSNNIDSDHYCWTDNDEHKTLLMNMFYQNSRVGSFHTNNNDNDNDNDDEQCPIIDPDQFEKNEQKFSQQMNDDDDDDDDDNNNSNVDDICILLDVYNVQSRNEDITDRTHQRMSTSYELLEPVELQLGSSIRHALDFAYMPVFGSAVLPTNNNRYSPYSSSDNDVDDDEHHDHDDAHYLQPYIDFAGKVHHYGNPSEEDEIIDTSLVGEVPPDIDHWWQWWVPSRWWKNKVEDDRYSTRYRMNHSPFAGGSHGEVWRGRRKCSIYEKRDQYYMCTEPLIFKRLRVEAGYSALEAGLREVYFGTFLVGTNGVVVDHETGSTSSTANTESSRHLLFTQYLEHFFGHNGELWIVFRDAGISLRSYLYAAADVGGFVVFKNSWFWTLLRMSVAKKKQVDRKKKQKASTDDHKVGIDEENNAISFVVVDPNAQTSNDNNNQQNEEHLETAALVGKELLRSILRQILEAASFLHNNGIIHRDIKPSNIMCESSFDPENLQSLNIHSPEIHCVLGDFSSAYNDFTRRNLYMNGPSRAEQTDEYAPPEAIFGNMYNESASTLTAAFDSWSIGIVALELLLGTPNVFSVDQRTRAVLSHKMKKKGATPDEIKKAMYLAALSQFCIYSPMNEKGAAWPLRDGDPLHKSAMTKQSCTLNDFHRALRARDPLGWGFNNADTLLQLIWQLLSWDPSERITASEALRHPYFNSLNIRLKTPEERNALESQMLDPRIDFDSNDTPSEYRCPKCGRIFNDWKSCSTHAISRKHAKFCSYDKGSLPTCLHAHSMLPAHTNSGYCDIQGRRPSIEDFHAIHLLPSQQFYGIFDGHLGNLASKYAASFLYNELESRFGNLLFSDVMDEGWKAQVERAASDAVAAVHTSFLEALSLSQFGFMDNSGTTATTATVTNSSIVITSLGDSRAVISSRRPNGEGIIELTAIQLTKDHQANDPYERIMVENLGARVVTVNGIERVNGVLVITRSIGDANLANVLSRQPQVLAMSRDEISQICGSAHAPADLYPCFLIVASDGLWDTVTNQEAVDMVAHVIAEETASMSNVSWRETAAFQRAAEALTLESFVRGSTDNIGVCIVALD